MEIASIGKITFDNISDFSTETLSDGFGTTWELLPKWKKGRHIMLVELAINNDEIMPEEIHEKWIEFKTLDGWKYDFTYNREAKTSPNLLAFPDLPTIVKAKTFLFLSQINVLRHFLE